MLTEYEIEKRDIRSVHAVEAAPGALPSGSVRLAINRVALTANNVTYAASGDALRYWSFFPVSRGDVGDSGLVPVWGIATVVESQLDDINAGERVYGFWPMASHVVVEPIRLRPGSFVDGAVHRQELPEIYNFYQRLVGPLAELDTDMLDRFSLLYPLFGTSYLLDDFLSESDWFEADELMITSASSKTAIGLASQTMRHETRPRVVGLTSRANKAFVSSLGCYDKLVVYDDVPGALGEGSPMLVDLAGNTGLRSAVHQHFGDKLHYSCAVGTSHWSSFNPRGRVPAGPKPVFFFAPSQSEKRRQEWGAQVLQQKMFESWLSFATYSQQWLQVLPVSGADAVIAAWHEAADGKVDPGKGLILELA